MRRFYGSAILMLSAAGVLGFAEPTSATMIVQYDFEGSNTAATVSTTASAPYSTLAANVTASAFNGNNGTGGLVGGSPSYTLTGTTSSGQLQAPSGNDVYFVRTSGTSNAQDVNDYLQFTITPDAGYKMTLSDLMLDVGRVAADFTSTIAVRSSVDSYANNLTFTYREPYPYPNANTGSGSSPGSINLTTWAMTATNFADTDNNGHRLTLDLSAPAFANLTAATTFRIYVWDSKNDSSYNTRFDNFTLSGTVTAVPEPGSAVLMLLGALSLCRIRWRRFV